MRTYKVNGLEHRVYDPDDEMPLDLLVLRDWRLGQVGEWVMADDDSVIQIPSPQSYSLAEQFPDVSPSHSSIHTWQDQGFSSFK